MFRGLKWPIMIMLYEISNMVVLHGNIIKNNNKMVSLQFNLLICSARHKNNKPIIWREKSCLIQ